MNKALKKRLVATAAGTGLLALVNSAYAAAPTTLSDLTASSDFTIISLSILAITGSMIPVYVVWKGSKFVTRAIKGA